MTQNLNIPTMLHGLRHLPAPAYVVQIWNAGEWHVFDAFTNEKNAEMLLAYLKVPACNKRILMFT